MKQTSLLDPPAQPAPEPPVPAPAPDDGTGRQIVPAEPPPTLEETMAIYFGARR